MPLDRILRNLLRWRSVDGPQVPLRDLTVEESRRRYRAAAIRPRTAERDGTDRVTVADEKIDADDSTPLRCRVYTPETDRGRVVTYLHGGGWVLGDLDTHDRACRLVAERLGAVVVSVDYRRAPEHPHPVPLRDSIAGARWTSRVFRDRVHVLAGDSAGAALALGVALHARDHDDVPIAAQLLLYPPVDPSLRLASAGPHAEGYLLSVDDMAWHYDLYVPDHDQRRDPAVDLLNADLSGLPPAVVATAEFDPLCAEGDALAAKLREQGVSVRHVPGPGLVHGYFLMHDLVPAAAARGELVLAELDSMLDHI
jgi:acetyl esterase